MLKSQSRDRSIDGKLIFIQHDGCWEELWISLYGCQTPAQHRIKILHPWVQEVYPVLGLGSGGRLLRHFQTPTLHWIHVSLRIDLKEFHSSPLRCPLRLRKLWPATGVIWALRAQMTPVAGPENLNTKVPPKTPTENVTRMPTKMPTKTPL